MQIHRNDSDSDSNGNNDNINACTFQRAMSARVAQAEHIHMTY